MHNKYVIGTSLQRVGVIGGDMPFTPEDFNEIGTWYQIPLQVRQAASQAALTRTGYTWPRSFVTLLDGVPVCVDRLHTWLHFDQNMNVVRRRYVQLRVEDQAVCRAYWLVLGHHYGPQAHVPHFTFGMWYNEFMNMYTGNPAQGYVRIDLEQYYVRHDETPALEPEKFHRRRRRRRRKQYCSTSTSRKLEEEEETA